MQAVAWFVGSQSNLQGLQYLPELHGTACEWLADIIAVPEKKKQGFGHSKSMSNEVRTTS